MKFEDNIQRFLTAIDGRPVFAHRGRKDGQLKNIFPATTEVRVVESAFGRHIQVTLFDKKPSEGVQLEGSGTIVPNHTDMWGNITHISVNIDGNNISIPGSFRCYTTETQQAHQEWLTTPDGVAHLDRLRQEEEAWRELKEREVAEFATNLKLAEARWTYQERRWVRRFIESNGDKSTSQAISVLLKVPGWLTWRAGRWDSDLPDKLRRILAD